MSRRKRRVWKKNWQTSSARKAPPAVVEKEREKLEAAKEKKKAVEERLAYLAKL